MTKIRTTLTIEEEVYEKAKKHIPNLSEFLEECLKYYFGLADGMMPIVNDQELLDEIGKLQAKLFISKQNFDVEESIKRAENFEKNKAWRFLWNDYFRKLIPDKQLLATAVEVLGVDEETLEDLLDEVYEARDKLDTDEWATVKEWYDKVIE